MHFCGCSSCGGRNVGPVFAILETGAGAVLPEPALPGAPDSALANASALYLAAISEPVMVRHCLRAFHFAEALAEKAAVKPDREILYIACLLHDLGLEPLFEAPDDFEAIGARAARNFLEFKGGSPIADRVAEAIDLHTSLTSAADPRPEVAYLHMGTMMDVVGARLDQIRPAFIQRVIEEFPRDGAKATLATLLGRQIETKPSSRIGMMNRTVDIVARIKGAPFAN